MANRVVIVFDKLPIVAAHLQRAAADLVRTAAFNVEARAKAHAAVDTGAMRAAIYTVSHDSSGYSAAAAEATSASATAAEHLQSEEPRPAKPTSAVVHAAMDYSGYVEYGTGRMAAQPFMTPAVAEEQPRLQQALRKLAGELESGI